jgi:hypothetical protein
MHEIAVCHDVNLLRFFFSDGVEVMFARGKLTACWRLGRDVWHVASFGAIAKVSSFNTVSDTH